MTGKQTSENSRKRKEHKVADSVKQQDRGNVQLPNELSDREKREDLFPSLFELSPDGMVLIDPYDPDVSWPIVDVNAAACKMNGYTREEMIGQSIDLLNITPGTPEERTEYYNALREDESLHAESIHRRKNGETFPVEISTTFITVGGRELILGIDRDITERKQMEKKLEAEREMLRTLIDNLPDLIYAKDIQSRFILGNQAIARIMGVSSPADLIGKTDREFYPEDLADEYSSDEQNVFQTGQPLINKDETIVNPNGSHGQILTTKVPLFDENEVVTGLVGIGRDITERKKTETKLQQSLSTINATLEASRDAILVVDGEGKIMKFNQHFIDMWNIPDFQYESWTDKQTLMAVFANVIDPDLFVEKILRMYQEPDNNSLDILNFKDGRVFECYSQPQQISGKSFGRVWNFRDITEHKLAEEKLVYTALHDPLTKLPNRILLMDRLQQAMERAKRNEDSVLAVLFIDLDRFKVVNDSLGHRMGDMLLVECAARLQACIRAKDTLARLGGDEFVLLLEDIKDDSDVLHIANRIMSGVTAPYHLEGNKAFVSLSMGIVLKPENYSSPDDILRDADIAMYRAKGLGRGRYEIFDSAMHDLAISQMELENDLRTALELEQFVVHYQPIYKLGSRRIVGFEALVRWMHPERGQISPSEFIPMAEDSGLIVPLGYWIMDKACRQIKIWQEQYPSDPPLTVNVNLSTKQCTHADLITTISDILEKNNLDPKSLKLELTESLLVEDSETTVAILSQLRDLGIQVQIDDFGTGYSSLNYLHTLPIDTLKIDRTFINRLGTNEGGLEIVQTILALAHSLGMKAIAEGVETEVQLDQLREMNCEYVQGYLLARPVDSQAAGNLLKETSQAVEE